MGWFTGGLAVTGTILAWLPLIAPVAFSGAALARDGQFRFDYLMPAELFPLALVGGGLLLWAAIRAQAQVKLIGWGIGGAAALLAGSQGLAIVTGLASGAIEPQGWPWMAVIAGLALYVIALLAVAIGGALLVREAFRTHRRAA